MIIFDIGYEFALLGNNMEKQWPKCVLSISYSEWNMKASWDVYTSWKILTITKQTNTENIAKALLANLHLTNSLD